MASVSDAEITYALKRISDEREALETKKVNPKKLSRDKAYF